MSYSSFLPSEYYSLPVPALPPSLPAVAPPQAAPEDTLFPASNNEEPYPVFDISGFVDVHNLSYDPSSFYVDSNALQPAAESLYLPPFQYPLHPPHTSSKNLNLSIPSYSTSPPSSEGYETNSTPTSNYSSADSPAYYSDYATSATSRLPTPVTEQDAKIDPLESVESNHSITPSPSRVSSTPRASSVSHPYSRTTSGEKKKSGRRIWNHALEKFLFTPHEIATLGAPNRRTIYLASLEAHVDRLHSQLLGLGLYPVPFEALLPFKGLNCKTAKGMVAGLQFDIAAVRLNLFELDRATASLKNAAEAQQQQEEYSVNPGFSTSC